MSHGRVMGMLLMLAGMLSGCGVPREAGRLAAQAAATDAAAPADDDALRQRLAGEDQEWSVLAALLQQREFGGIVGVDPSFVQLVNQTAALAKRQHELLDQHADTPALNHEALEKFQRLWSSANHYLNP